MLSCFEMLFCKAGATERLKIARVEEDLNALRFARIENYASERFTSKDAVIEAIMTERFKEIALEGHIF